MPYSHSCSAVLSEPLPPPAAAGSGQWGEWSGCGSEGEGLPLSPLTAGGGGRPAAATETLQEDAHHPHCCHLLCEHSRGGLMFTLPFLVPPSPCIYAWSYLSLLPPSLSPSPSLSLLSFLSLFPPSLPPSLSFLLSLFLLPSLSLPPYLSLSLSLPLSLSLRS